MDSAPRDGSWIEFKNDYGVAHYFNLARWTDDGVSRGSNGEAAAFKLSEPRWQTREGGRYWSEAHLQWRVYSEDLKSFVDPTGGLQNNMAYWRGAMAHKNDFASRLF